MFRHLWVSCVLLSVVSCTQKNKALFSPELRTASATSVEHMDPARTVTVSVADAVSLVYEGLLEFHYLKRPYEVIPNLLQKMPDVSKDHTTYTLTLKKGIRFHPDTCFGKEQTREVVASDVEYSFKRLIDAKVLSPLSAEMQALWPGAKSFYETSQKNTPTDYTLPVDALKTIDRYTFQMKLNYPFSLLYYYLANPHFFIVPRECVEHYGKSFQNHPVGTGPFILKKWVRKSLREYEANPHYHGRYPTEGMPEDREAGLLEDAGKPLPLVSKLVITVIQEVEPMFLKFLRGDLDFSSIPDDRYDAVITKGELSEDVKKKGIVARNIQGIIVRYMAINHQNPHLGNVHVRRALSLALDMPKVLKQLYGDKYIPAPAMVPPLLFPPGKGSFENPYAGLNLLRAKEELKKAGFPEGKGLPAFKVATASGPEYRRFVEALDLETKQVGIRLEFDGLNEIQWSKVLQEGQFDLLISGGQGNYPDAETFLAGAYSKNWPHGGNHGKFMDAQFDAWYEKILRLPLDSVERNDLIARMIRLIQDQVVEIPLWLYNSYSLRYNTIQNYKNNHNLFMTTKYLKKVPRPTPSP